MEWTEPNSVTFSSVTGTTDLTGMTFYYDDGSGHSIPATVDFSAVTPNGGDITVQWDSSGLFTVDTLTPPAAVFVPADMTVEQANELLTTCVLCGEPAPGVCPICAEAVKKARQIMVAEWIAELKDFQTPE